MYKQILKSVLLFSSFTSASPILGSFNEKNIRNEGDLIETIAEKYESATINPTKITFNNLWYDIKSSSFDEMMLKAVDINFEISKANADDSFYFYYQDAQHGPTSQQLYQKGIRDLSISTLEYLAVITLASKIAHYYGDNKTMDQNLRSLVITEDIYLFGTLFYILNNSIEIEGNLCSLIRKASDDPNSIINDVLKQNYKESPLLQDYNDINYNQLTTYNGNLHAVDDYFVNVLDNRNDYAKEKYYSDQEADWFCLGTNDNHNLIKIKMASNFRFIFSIKESGWVDLVTTMLDPYNFDILLNS